MAAVRGYVEHIVYRNSENGYTVLEIAGEEGGRTLVGTLPPVSEGELLEAEGSFTAHPLYGEQFTVDSCRVMPPDDTVSVERYLGSGAIKGIGPALAARIVKKFGNDTLRVIDEEPERLAEVKGISEKGARDIAEQVVGKRELREAMIFLQQYGISLNLAVKIYEQYGSELYTLIRTNPYQIADDIPGVGFRIADEIAEKAGIRTDSDFRIRSGLLYTLTQGVSSGHVCLPRRILYRNAAEILHVPTDSMDKPLMDLVLDGRVVVKTADPEDFPGVQSEEEAEAEDRIYSAVYYYTELNAAKRLLDLNIDFHEGEKELLSALDQIQAREELTLDALQRQAVLSAVHHGVTVITGGPGTGKTTTIQTILRCFEQADLEVELAAPTGRAARRMTEATGHEARTIHRLLEFNGTPGEGADDSVKFERNENHPLEADAVIIDEMSMVDINLIYALLKALTVGTRLILVGDADQLPSVGPGNVLRDIIRSDSFPVVKLTHIFRQSEASDIVINAHRIHDGKVIDPDRRSRDFLFVRRQDAGHILGAVRTLVKEKLPDYVGADISEIQVMTPMRKGVLGVENLNTMLQACLNPPDPSKKEKAFAHAVFREGDKVMQVRNNYQAEWEIRSPKGVPLEKGEGVFNGDMGLIREINLFTEEFTVEFDEGRQITYPFRQAEELELAYAITVHKSQGSEYPAVVLPILSGPRMLMTRSLIYTAVTRAKKCVCIVGPVASFQAMVDNATEQKRYSGLDRAVREIASLPGISKFQEETW